MAAEVITDELRRLVAKSSTPHEEFDETLTEYLEGLLGEEEEEGEEGVITETLIAYIPSLEAIPRSELESWTTSLKQRLRRAKEGRTVSESSAASASSLDAAFSLRIAHPTSPTRKEKTDIDPELKDSIVNRHAMVGESKEGSYRPTMPPKPTKEESKVRYREGAVVNMKGQKWMEQKKEESEEMKKTYINLKPAKKYRFH